MRETGTVFSTLSQRMDVISPFPDSDCSCKIVWVCSTVYFQVSENTECQQRATLNNGDMIWNLFGRKFSFVRCIQIYIYIYLLLKAHWDCIQWLLSSISTLLDRSQYEHHPTVITLTCYQLMLQVYHEVMWQLYMYFDCICYTGKCFKKQNFKAIFNLSWILKTKSTLNWFF